MATLIKFFPRTIDFAVLREKFLFQQANDFTGKRKKKKQKKKHKKNQTKTEQKPKKRGRVINIDNFKKV